MTGTTKVASESARVMERARVIGGGETLVEAERATIEVGSIVMSDPCDQIAAAFVRAQTEMPRVLPRDKTATIKMKDGGEYSYGYTSFDSLIEAVRPFLTVEKIALIQAPAVNGTRVDVTTMLLHESGQYISCTLTLRAKTEAIHDLGSAITYNRRYAGGPMLGIASEDDDDGKRAQHGSAAGHAQAEAPERDERKYGNVDREKLTKVFFGKLYSIAGKALPDGFMTSELTKKAVRDVLIVKLTRTMDGGPRDGLDSLSDDELRQCVVWMEEFEPGIVNWFRKGEWFDGLTDGREKIEQLWRNKVDLARGTGGGE